MAERPMINNIGVNGPYGGGVQMCQLKALHREGVRRWHVQVLLTPWSAAWLLTIDAALR